MKTTTFIPHDYNSAIVTFTGDAFVNLTEMCAVFGAAPAQFLRLDAAKRFLMALAADTGLSSNYADSAQLKTDEEPNGLVVTLRGRHNSGTWAHPDLALECARWLSPEFAIWTNRIIRGLMAGRVPHPAMDYRQLCRLESQAKEMAMTARADRARIAAALDIPGNFSTWIYAACAGLPSTRYPNARVGQICMSRCLALGLPVGKVRQQTKTKERLSSVATYPVEMLRSAWLHLGYPHETPEPTAMLARWKPLLSSSHRLNASPLALV